MNRVFVYGSLMSGMGNSAMMSGAKLIGKCTALPGQFVMVDLGPFPGLVADYSGREVKGELYEVSDEHLRDLDNLEGCPNFYWRGTALTSLGFAWIYLLQNRSQCTMVVESGDWREHLKLKETSNV